MEGGGGGMEGGGGGMEGETGINGEGKTKWEVGVVLGEG